VWGDEENGIPGAEVVPHVRKTMGYLSMTKVTTVGRIGTLCGLTFSPCKIKMYEQGFL